MILEVHFDQYSALLKVFRRVSRKVFQLDLLSVVRLVGLIRRRLFPWLANAQRESECTIRKRSSWTRYNSFVLFHLRLLSRFESDIQCLQGFLSHLKSLKIWRDYRFALVGGPSQCQLALTRNCPWEENIGTAEVCCSFAVHHCHLVSQCSVLLNVWNLPVPYGYGLRTTDYEPKIWDTSRQHEYEIYSRCYR